MLFATFHFAVLPVIALAISWLMMSRRWLWRPFILARPLADHIRRAAPTRRTAVLALGTAVALCGGAGGSLAARPDGPGSPRLDSARAATGQGGRRTSPHAVGASQSTPAICARLGANAGKLRLGGHRKRLTVLATGDSMIYPIDQVLAIDSPPGMRVVADRHDGTGLTTDKVNWRDLSAQQATRIRPDLTVISLGGRDGGIPLPDVHHRLVSCCGAAWLGLYAGLLRPLLHAYLRGGRGRVYWLLLPAPRERARAPLYGAVNEALRLLAPEFGGSLRLIRTDAVISPGGYQETITYDGLKIHPRAPDGIHLNHAGACVERSLVFAAMRADGMLLTG
jgi:hypothetical protein